MSTVGSIVVTNLTTGKRIGSLDKAEVFHNLMYFFCCGLQLTRHLLVAILQVYFHDIPDEVIGNLVGSLSFYLHVYSVQSSS